MNSMTKRSTSVGNRCCFSNCGCSSVKCRGLSFHKIPSAGKSADQDAWRNCLIYLASRSDDRFKPDKAKICSRHFTDDCFVSGPNSTDFRGRHLKFGAIPTQHLPKSIASIQREFLPKSPASIPCGARTHTTDGGVGVPETQQPHYGSIEDLRKALPREVSSPWCLLENSSRVRVALIHSGNVQVEVTIQPVPQTESPTCMVASVRVFGFPARKLQCRFLDRNLRTLLHDLCEMSPCSGLTDPKYQDMATLCDGRNVKPYYRHVTNNVREDGSFSQQSCVRSRDCRLLLPKSNQSQHLCRGCAAAERALKVRIERKSRKPASKFDPLHGLSEKQLKDAFKKQRAEIKKLTEFKEKMQKESIALPAEKHQEFLQCVDTTKIEDPLVKLFWEEQRKAFARKDRGARWHPMMLALALLLHSKGPAAYETLRELGIVKLPGTSTLRDCAIVVCPPEGAELSVQEELRNAADQLGESSQEQPCQQG